MMKWKGEEMGKYSLSSWYLLHFDIECSSYLRTWKILVLTKHFAVLECSEFSWLPCPIHFSRHGKETTSRFTDDFCVAATVFWNGLPKELVDLESLLMFTRSCKLKTFKMAVNMFLALFGDLIIPWDYYKILIKALKEDQFYIYSSGFRVSEWLTVSFLSPPQKRYLVS